VPNENDRQANENDNPQDSLDPMRIWSQWSSDTPRDALKEFKKAGGFSGTAIDVTYRFERLTQLFGPNGQGWGFEIVERWREDFAGHAYVFVRGFIWYVDPSTGKRCETSHQIGGTYGDRSPDEVWKMSITDAATKCCQLLGLAADVYRGQMDGNKYLMPEGDAKPKSRAKPKQQQQRPPAEPKPKPPAADAINAVLKAIDTATDREALKGPWQWFKLHEAALPEAQRETMRGLFTAKGAQLKNEAAQ